jgi:uncharacterized membrane protein
MPDFPPPPRTLPDDIESSVTLGETGMNDMTANAYEKNDKSSVVLCHICYGLYALGIISFITTILGVIINYITRSSATSDCLSHHNWMIKTFWISIIILMMLTILIILMTDVLTPSIVPIFGITVSLPFLVWYIYRIVKGWLRLCKRKSI